MSQSVDKRVVEMNFDNSRFESNANKTLGTLNRLNNALKMSEATKGFQDIQAAANNVKFTGVESGVESLKQRFSSLGIVGMTVIQNITTGVMNLAKSLASKAFHGGVSRALGIEQAKFMIEGLGADFEKISDDINYAVQDTAFGFDEAARAASQFSASGIKAGDDMKSALRSVSGVASMTGSSYEDISNIFTKVAGQGRLMGDDLLSMSSRGMNAAAILGKSMHKSEQEIRDMVSKGEISFKEFAEVMDKNFGEHSKEANRTFSGSLRNVNAALSRLGAAFITPLIETQELNKESRNLVRILNAVKDVINGFNKYLEKNGVYKRYTKVIQKISTALGDFVQAIAFTEDGTKNLEQRMADFFKTTKADNSTISNLVTTIKGLKAAVDIVLQAFKALIGGLKPAGQAGGNLLSVILSITAAISRFIISVDDFIKKTGIFKGVVISITSVLKGLTKAIKNIAGGVGKGLNSIFGLKSEKDTKSLFDSIFDPLEKLVDVSKNIGDLFVRIGAAIGDGIASIFDRIDSAFSAPKAMGAFNMALFTSIALTLKKFVNTLKAATVKMSTISRINGVLFELKNTLSVYQRTLKAGALIKIATAIAILTASVLVLSGIDVKGLAKAVVAIGALMAMLQLSLKGLSKFGLKQVFTLAQLGEALISLSIAVAILSAAVLKLSKMDFGEMIVGLGSLALILKMLISFSKEIEKESKGIIRTATAMLVFGIAINILATAVNNLGKMKLKTLVKGLGSIAILMQIIAGFNKVMKNPAQLLNFASGMLILSVAMNVLSKAVSAFGKMGLKTLGKGLGSVILLLGSFAGLSKLIEPKSFILMATSMVILSEALARLVKPIAKLGKMDGNALVQGLMAIAGALGILAISAQAMKGALPGAIGIIIMAGAILTLTPALEALAKLSLVQLATMLAALAGVFVIFGAAAATLAPVVVPMLALAGAIALLGAAVFLAGTGIAAFAVGLTTLATSAAIVLAAVPTMISAIVKAIEEFLIKIAEASPRLIEAGMVILLNFLQGILNNLPQIIETGMQIVMALLDGISSNLTELVTKGVDIVVAFITGINQNIGRVIDAGFKLVIAFINGLANAIDKNSATFGAAVGHLFVTAILAVPKFIFGAIGSIGSSLLKAGKAIKNKIIEGFTSAKDKIKQKGKDFIKWLKDGIEGKIPDVKKSGKKAGKAGKDGAEEGAKGTKTIGKNMVQGLMDGVGELADKLKNKIKNLGSDALKKLKDKLGIKSPSREFMKVGRYAIQGFILGIDSLASNAINSVGSVAGRTVNAMSKAIGLINDSVEDNINSEPVIRPVLDLSNLNNANLPFGDSTIGVGASSAQASSLNRAMGEYVMMNEEHNAELMQSQLMMSNALNELVDVTKSEGVDPNRIYDAVRQGAEAATFRIIFNGRELKRELKNLGVMTK